MNRRLSRLMDDVLELQDDLEDFDDVEFALRVREALAQGAELPSDLRAILWRSPTARWVYAGLRAEAAVRARRTWQANGYDTAFERLAADSDGDSESFNASGILMTITINAATMRWLVSLKVTPEAFRDLPRGISVRVSDRGGKIWLEGMLDRYGGLDGWWDDDDVGPRDRARQYGLTFDFF